MSTRPVKPRRSLSNVVVRRRLSPRATTFSFRVSSHADALPPARFEMRRLPPDRHVECLAEDWVDLVPQRELHHLHPYDDATPAPSGRRFTNVVASPPALPSPPASSPDAWLALAEESMRPPRADAPARRARRAARLVRACATALEPRDGAPGAKTTTEGKDGTLAGGKEPEARALASAPPQVSATRFYSSGVSASASHERRPQGNECLGTRARVLFVAAATAAVVLFFMSRPEYVVSRFSADAPRRVPDGEAYPEHGGLPSFPACDASRTSDAAIASLRLALARTRANEDALRRNATAADAAADAWHRASEAWYDAFTRAVETNAALSRGLKTKPPQPFWP